MASQSSISAIYQAILQRPADPGEALSFLSDTTSDLAVAQAIASSPAALGAPAAVIRIYEAVFGRKPDAGGLDYWVDRLTSEPGFDIYKMAQFFVGSQEYKDRYGVTSLDDASAKQTLIELLYKNVLGRPADAEGLKYWMASDLTPAQLLVQFSESKEFVDRTAPEIQRFFVDIAITGSSDPSGSDGDDYSGSIIPTTQPAPGGGGGNTPATFGGQAAGTVTEDGGIGVKQLPPAAVLPTAVVPGVGVVQPAIKAAVPDNEVQNVGGTLTVVDPDPNQQGFNPVNQAALKTKYGSFTFNEKTGEWTFALDNKAAQELKGGEEVKQTLTVSSLDGTTKDIVVTVVGKNDPLEILRESVSTGAVTEDGGVRPDKANVVAANVDPEVNAANKDAAVAVADEPKVIEAKGQLLIRDIDAGESKFQPVDVRDLKKTYGDFTFNSETGAWTYVLDNAKAQVLKGDDAVEEVLSVKSIDGTPFKIVVQVNGTNDIAVIGGDVTGQVTEDNFPVVKAIPVPAAAADEGQQAQQVNDAIPAEPAITTSGNLTITDVDKGEQLFQKVADAALKTDFGRFEFNHLDGSWKFTLDNEAAQALKGGESVVEKLTVTSIDGQTTKAIEVTVKGAEDAAKFDGDLAKTVDETNVPLEVTGKAGATDADKKDGPGFQPATGKDILKGVFGDLEIDSAGKWQFTAKEAFNSLNVGDSREASFTVKSKDGTEQKISITIKGTDDASTFGGDLSAAANETNAPITLNGKATVKDVDNKEEFKPQTLESKLGKLTIDAAGAWTFTASGAFDELKSGEKAEGKFTVESVGGTKENITITINGTNDAPTDITLVSGKVPENEAGAVIGKITTADLDANDTYTYLIDDNRFFVENGDLKLRSGFSLNYEEKPVIGLTVKSTDSANASVVRQVLFEVKDVNEAPVAQGGTATVNEDGSLTGQKVPTATDPDGTTPTYKLVSATANGTLTFDETTGGFSYTPNRNFNGTDTFKYKATDGSLDSAEATFSITVAPVNDAALITGTALGSVREATPTDPGQSTSTGKLTAADFDGPSQEGFNAVTNATSANGYGKFSIQRDGNWTYVLDNANATVNNLASNAILSDSFTVTSIDGTPRTVSININGVTDAKTSPDAFTGTGDPNDAERTGGVKNGTDKDDLIVGSTKNDELEGKKGNDTIYGLQGSDEIDGGDGDDKIYGGSNVDEIVGGDGKDTIIGGFGADKLRGNEKNDSNDNTQDVFVFLDAKDTGDTISGYDATDLIAFSGDLAGKLTFGNLEIKTSGGNTIVNVDIPGDLNPAYEMQFTIQGIHNLTNDNFRFNYTLS